MSTHRYSCPACGSEEVNATVNTNQSTYCRCRHCLAVWGEPRIEPPPRGPYRRRRGDRPTTTDAVADAQADQSGQPAFIDVPRCPFCLRADRVRLAEAVAPWWDARFFACTRCDTEWATGPLFSDRRRVPRKDHA